KGSDMGIRGLNRLILAFNPVNPINPVPTLLCLWRDRDVLRGSLSVLCSSGERQDWGIERIRYGDKQIELESLSLNLS
ncbi:MAG: hypothetical protein AAGA10_20720, partial [Bacteroidota bacterium]